MRRSLGLCGVLVLAALIAPPGAEAALPDLIVSSLTVTPTSVAAGGSVDIFSEIRNTGAATVPLPPRVPGVPPEVSTWVNYFLVASPADTHGVRLTGWGPLVAMPPGSAQHYTSHATIPATTAPGSYFVCADVDAYQHVTESNEANNRQCRPLKVAGGKGGPQLRFTPVPVGVPRGVGRPIPRFTTGKLPDLRITSVVGGGVSGVSRAVALTVLNAGGAPATNFRMDAFQLVPRRWPLLFTVCPQTSHAGGSATCASVWEPGTLAAGASRTYKGWVTFPADHKSGEREKVEFMADGCFPPLEPAIPAGCRVAESNEANNTETAPVTVP
jgi:hypothetical protein